MSDEVTITVTKEEAENLLDFIGSIPDLGLMESGISHILVSIYRALKSAGLQRWKPLCDATTFSAPKNILDDDFVKGKMSLSQFLASTTITMRVTGSTTNRAIITNPDS